MEHQPQAIRRAPATGPGLGRVRSSALALAASAVVVAFGLFIGWLSVTPRDDVSPPTGLAQTLVLAGLFALPGLVGFIGVGGQVRPLLVAASVLCLFESVLSFTGVTLALVLPAVVLLWAGTRGGPTWGPTLRAAWLVALAVVALGGAAWIASFAMTETSCWVASRTQDGGIVYHAIPETSTPTLAGNDIASGCDGGTPTPAGLLVTTVLGLGAVAVALAAPREATRP